MIVDVVPRSIAVAGDPVQTCVKYGNVIHIAEVVQERGAHPWVRTDCGIEGISTWAGRARKHCAACLNDGGAGDRHARRQDAWTEHTKEQARG